MNDLKTVQALVDALYECLCCLDPFDHKVTTVRAANARNEGLALIETMQRTPAAAEQPDSVHVAGDEAGPVGVMRSGEMSGANVTRNICPTCESLARSVMLDQTGRA